MNFQREKIGEQVTRKGKGSVHSSSYTSKQVNPHTHMHNDHLLEFDIDMHNDFTMTTFPQHLHSILTIQYIFFRESSYPF